MRKPVKQRNRFLFNFHFLHPQKLKFHIQKFSRSKFIDPCTDIFSRNRSLKDFKRFGLEFRIRVNVKGHFLPGYFLPPPHLHTRGEFWPTFIRALARDVDR